MCSAAGQVPALHGRSIPAATAAGCEGANRASVKLPTGARQRLGAAGAPSSRAAPPSVCAATSGAGSHRDDRNAVSRVTPSTGRGLPAPYPSWARNGREVARNRARYSALIRSNSCCAASAAGLNKANVWRACSAQGAQSQTTRPVPRSVASATAGRYLQTSHSGGSYRMGVGRLRTSWLGRFRRAYRRGGLFFTYDFP
jgi:hypothetical protein